MRRLSPYSDKINRKESPVMLLLAVLSIFSFALMFAFL